MEHRWDPRESNEDQPACPGWDRDDLVVRLCKDANGRAFYAWTCDEPECGN